MQYKDREPVMAHLRFEQNRQSLEGLSLADRFKRIEQINMWGASGSVSGLGSERQATEAMRNRLPGLFDHLGVQSILDAPCGDANWIREVTTGIAYTGIDIVPSLIEQNVHQWTGNDAHRFMVADITEDPLPPADLILCRDCLVHLSFAHIDAAAANFRASGARWLLTTTFPLLEENNDCEDGDWRALNLTLPPFCWPQPQMLIGESCLEANGTWRDKSLGLWPLDATVAVSGQ